jgi:beta-lactam-binding protein with PASTA domain/predicted Ser/Thr protein kinase
MAVPTIIGERYDLERPVGRGGMAEVYLGRDRRLDRPVAVKVMHDEYAGNAAFQARFEREARAMAGLNHPNMVQVYDYGRENGAPYIVMEYVRGKTMRDLVREQGPAPPERAAEVMADVAGALQYAHENGIIHRDVKPGNIMIDTEGTVKVTDFGIAQDGRDEEQLTQAGSVVGTAAYFSPEQAQGKPADARSDVYAMGCVLYELVTGRPPYDGETSWAIAYKQVNDPVPDPRALRPDLPDGVRSIILRAMAKDPNARYQTAREMRDDLLRFCAGMATVAAVTETPTTMLAPQPAMAVGAPYGSPMPEKRKRWPALLGILALLLVAGLGVFLLVRALSGEDGVTRIVVPDVTGQPVETARNILENEGFKTTTTTEASDTVPANTVIRTEPAAGKRAEAGSTVTIVASTGPDAFEVPDVVGQDVATARSEMERLGFVVEVQTRTSDEPEGRVIEQDPAPGQRLAKGGTVVLVVSAGPERTIVPDVIGFSQSEAETKLRDAGFDVTTVQAESEQAPGTVISSVPVAGARAAKGSTVTIRVSAGVKVEVPSVVGDLRPEAAAALEGAGFKVRVQEAPTDNLDEAQRVLSQDPAAGTSAQRGSTVTITVGKFAGTGPPGPTG